MRGALDGLPLLVAVVVGVAGEGVLDAVPGVAGGIAGLVPGLPRRAARLVPATLQVGLHVFEALAGVLTARLPAVLVGWLVILVAAVRVHIWTGAVVLAPIGILHSGVDPLGDAVAHEAARHSTDRRADQSSDRTGPCRPARAPPPLPGPPRRPESRPARPLPFRPPRPWPRRLPRRRRCRPDGP